MRTKPVTSYSSFSKLLHWGIALLVITMLCMGFFMADFPKEYKGTAYMLHKSVGISILFLVFLRFFWISRVGKPALPTAVSRGEKMVIRFVQYTLYILLLFMPLSGWIMSVTANKAPIYFGLFKASLPWIKPNQAVTKFLGNWHENLAWILIGFTILHIMGALKHHFIDKDGVLRSMLPRRKNGDRAAS